MRQGVRAEMIILIRGGSISAGYGCDHSYCDILAQRLQKYNVKLINRSNYKDTSFEGVETFSSDIEPYKPDVLIIHFGMDDAYHPVYRSEFKENLVQLVRIASLKFSPHIMLMTSHPFENIYHMEEIYIYYRTIREVAVDLQYTLVPVHSIWNGIIDVNGYSHSEFLQKDKRYPDNTGQQLYADILEPYLLKLL